jgi:hypothetical protein
LLVSLTDISFELPRRVPEEQDFPQFGSRVPLADFLSGWWLHVADFGGWSGVFTAVRDGREDV